MFTNQSLRVLQHPLHGVRREAEIFFRDRTTSTQSLNGSDKFVPKGCLHTVAMPGLRNGFNSVSNCTLSIGGRVAPASEGYNSRIVLLLTLFSHSRESSLHKHFPNFRWPVSTEFSLLLLSRRIERKYA